MIVRKVLLFCILCAVVSSVAVLGQRVLSGHDAPQLSMAEMDSISGGLDKDCGTGIDILNNCTPETTANSCQVPECDEISLGGCLESAKRCRSNTYNEACTDSTTDCTGEYNKMECYRDGSFCKIRTTQEDCGGTKPDC